MENDPAPEIERVFKATLALVRDGRFSIRQLEYMSSFFRECATVTDALIDNIETGARKPVNERKLVVVP